MPARTAKLPDGIEIFRAGTHTDDSGTAHSFSEADLAAMASGYDPTVREAPLTVGHPEHDKPAYGFVRRLSINADGRLAMSTDNVEPQFAEMVAARRFPKRSASFYPPKHANNPKPGTWYLRHVAFLGAQPPAVSGLKDIQFADDATGLVNFSEATPAPKEPTMPAKTAEQLQAELDAVNAQLAAATATATSAAAKAEAAEGQLAQFAETAKAQRTAGFVSFAEAEFKAGRIRPVDKAPLVATLEALADSQPVDFAEGGQVTKLSLTDWMKGRVSAGAQIVNFGEHAPGDAGNKGGSVKGLSDVELDAKAKAWAIDKKCSYAEALSAICSFTS